MQQLKSWSSVKWHSILHLTSKLFHYKPPKEMVEGKNDIHEGHCITSYCSVVWGGKKLTSGTAQTVTTNSLVYFSHLHFSLSTLWKVSVAFGDIHAECCSTDETSPGKLLTTATQTADRMKHGTASIFTWIWHSCTASGCDLCSVKKRHWNVKDVWGCLKEERKSSPPCRHLSPLKSKTDLLALWLRMNGVGERVQAA